ncbi:threonine aldolase [Aliidiomarina shirensis]|uniref:Threonine aldolase n=1 Tax=Aliidiomarina shirensis TaxID=1048642 RepID=A0A432WWK4_9GAMM|nr:beta-eliminating lyase-related protein [Aliidiomarina shirensis]RUO38152.1 threonine aldolase [Aliidiomarina shirensis]
MERISMLRQPARSMAETLRALALAAEQVPERDCYGKGALINDLEQEVASMLGKPAALFLPSGTLAQPLALKIYSEQRKLSHIGLHPTSHLLLHEQHGYQHLWGLDALAIGAPERVWQLGDFTALPAQAMAAMIWELPAREIGGQLPTWEALNEQVAWAREHNIAVHFDGARLWQCPEYYQRSLAEIAGLADSVYVSFYKDLAGIAGAMLVGDEDFIAEARIWARRAGGNLYSQYPYLLAAKLGLQENLASIPQAVNYARELASAFAEMPNIRINPAEPQVAMFHLHIQADKQRLLHAIQAYSDAHHVEVLPTPRAEADGWQICEIPVGRNAMAKPVAFWQAHLKQLLALL